MNVKRFVSVLSTACCLAALPLRAEPLNEDEAYDPTDWFDGNNYEYDDTLGNDATYDYSYGYPDYASGGDNAAALDRALGYEYAVPEYLDGEGSEYGWHEQWIPSRNRFELDYGWHYGPYDYTPESDDYWEMKGNRAGQRSASSSKGSRQTSAGASSSRQSARRISGTIQEVRSLNLQNRSGAKDTRAIAKLKLQDGRSVLVDFGSARQRSGFDLNRGDWFQVQGHTGRINGRRVLFADSAWLDGQRFQIQQTGSQGMRNRSSETKATLSGTVEDFNRVYFDDRSGDRKEFVRLKLQNGKTCVADVGSNISKLELEKGSQITIHGQRTRVGGREVLRARQIEVDGETHNVNS